MHDEEIDDLLEEQGVPESTKLLAGATWGLAITAILISVGYGAWIILGWVWRHV